MKTLSVMLVFRTLGRVARISLGGRPPLLSGRSTSTWASRMSDTQGGARTSKHLGSRRRRRRSRSRAPRRTVLLATLAVTAALLPPDVPLLAADPSVVEVRVSSSADDAEEKATGSVSLGSSDLELTLEASTQTVGVRFGNLGIPQGAAISTAWMQFQADETNSEVTDLVIRGEAVDDASVFSTTSQNITSGR